MLRRCRRGRGPDGSGLRGGIARRRLDTALPRLFHRHVKRGPGAQLAVPQPEHRLLRALHHRRISGLRVGPESRQLALLGFALRADRLVGLPAFLGFALRLRILQRRILGVLLDRCVPLPQILIRRLPVIRALLAPRVLRLGLHLPAAEEPGDRPNHLLAGIVDLRQHPLGHKRRNRRDAERPARDPHGDLGLGLMRDVTPQLRHAHVAGVDLLLKLPLRRRVAGRRGGGQHRRRILRLAHERCRILRVAWRA